jgi:hypothetical protein
MRPPQTGGCQCGAIRYQIGEAPQLVFTCHCRECQGLTGSAFSMAVVTNTETFSLTGAAPAPTHGRQRAHGHPVGLPGLRHVDLERSEARSGYARCAPRPSGTLDDTSWLRPTVHFWTRSAQPWVVLPESDRRFETQPEDLAWMRAGSGQSSG